ncbi:MAG TPA: hypothetical protein VG820_05435 [Fimbriimonadaceae bacterium]|nr:hypothetical protein [Fimbriimonadaceae bacterium]
MVLIACSIALLASTPKPTAGPALPLHFLGKAKAAAIHIRDEWGRGCRSVDFTFYSRESVQELRSQIYKEFVVHPNGPGTNDQYTTWRKKDGISQSITVSKGGPLAKSLGAKPNRGTLIYVTEMPSIDADPARWYRRAISAKPPAPLIEVPFVPGLKCCQLSIGSLEQLLSTSLRERKEKDLVVYEAWTPSDMKSIAQKLSDWAAKNGYALQPYGSYFKPKAKIFEIECDNWQTNGKGTTITLYTTSKVVTSPIPHVKY